VQGTVVCGVSSFRELLKCGKSYGSEVVDCLHSSSHAPRIDNLDVYLYTVMVLAKQNICTFGVLFGVGIKDLDVSWFEIRVSWKATSLFMCCESFGNDLNTNLESTGSTKS
jgi:hypothetical protein